MKQSQSQIIQRELISKDKWKLDNEINKCYRCDKQFNVLIRRKHHCRRCGNIFCQDCSNYFLEGYQNHNNEKKIRLCMKCNDYIKQLISAKGYFVDSNDEQNIHISIKIESGCHSRNQSKQFDLASTFITQKSVIGKPYELDGSQEEDDTLQENNQDVEQFLEESDIEKPSSNKLAQLKEKNASQLEKICEYLLQNVLQNNKNSEKSVEVWKIKLKALILTCVQEVYFLSLKSEIMDINYYLKIKILPQVDEQLTSVFSGLIFRKNVALKQMQTDILNPIILLIKGDFDMDREKDREQIQFQDLLQKEQKHLIEKINKIQEHFKASVILVEKNANKIALDECVKRQITVLMNVKEKVLRRIQLCTGAKQIKLSRLDECIEKKIAITGKAYKLFFRTFPKKKIENESIKDQTFCFLQNQDGKKFVTVILSGAPEDILKKCKSCFQGCVRYGRHQDLECHMIVTETSMFQSKEFQIQSNLQQKIIQQCGNFTNFLYEKICLKDLIAKNECKYVKINYVLVDPSSIYDAKDLASIEKYKENHKRYSDKIEEFSIAKICNKPSSKKATYYGQEDVCLGQFIVLKISNKDKKCEDCHLPKNAHISIYYCGNKYIKISVDQKFRSGRIISTNDPPSLQQQLSSQSAFSQLSNEEDQNETYKAKDMGKILFQNHQDQNGQKSKIRIETYIQCRRCEFQSSIEKLSPQNLEFSLFRYFQTLLFSQGSNSCEKQDQLHICNHSFQRIFTYNESMVKLLVGDIDIYASVKLSYIENDIQEAIKQWEVNYLAEQKKELFKKIQNIGQHLLQIKQSQCKNLVINNQIFDIVLIEQNFISIITLQELWAFIFSLSLELQDIYDEIKFELKKHSNSMKHWDNANKMSMVKSQKELDFPSRSLVIQVDNNKGHLSGQDNEISVVNSASIMDAGDLDYIQENKSPLGGKASKSPQYKNSNQQSIKDLDSVHIPSQEKQTPELALLKEWPQCIFKGEQSKIQSLQPKIFSFVPIFENSSLSSIAFALNHPVYLKNINYYESFPQNDQDSKQILSKLLQTKPRQCLERIENEESNFPRESITVQSENASINQGKKEKNYQVVSLQYDKTKSLKPSSSKDQFQLTTTEDEKSFNSTQSHQSSLGTQQYQQVKKSRTYDILIYFPIQFEAFRQACGINAKQYITSLCTTISWNATGGKSSSQFFKSQDELFVIKQFEDDKEFRMFEQFALDYFRHMHRHLFETQKASLLCKIFGMYEIRDNGNSEYYIVMQNLYYGMGNLKDLLVYDLKGSELNRWEKKVDKVLLDTNFILDRNSEPIVLQTEHFNYNDKAFQNDCKFLYKKQIVDYSLLLIIDNKQKKIRIGIIDYFRFFTWDKKTEGFLKYVLKGGKVPTITNPNDYKERFIKAMEKYFIHT